MAKSKHKDEKKSCFLISPLGARNSEVRKLADGLYEMIVSPVCRRLGYELLRVDRVPLAGSITQHIIRMLVDADVVIADLTNQNPNVLYELGIRHSIGKASIQMSQEGERLPFDLQSYNTITYDLSSMQSMKRAAEILESTMKHIQEKGENFSPVTDAAMADVTLLSKKVPKADPQDSSPLLRSIVERLGAIEGSVLSIAKGIEETADKREYTRDVFIVHGHDGELKNELARLLQKLEFNPIILHEQADRGQTILQKLQYEGSRVGYAFILHTPDDEGKKHGADELNPRSRQNVVFEHGMFVGQFTHRRVCAIVRDNVEIPSDLSGVIYKRIPRDGGIGSVALEIVNELRAAGYVVDANKLLA